MHIHILGICGTFMGGVAALARAAGHRVTGCDKNVYPPMSTQLRELGVDIHEGFDAGQLDNPADAIVVGNVMSRGMPVVEAMLDRDLPYTSGPRWLADNVLRGRHVIAVAGTHGKTTTASMLFQQRRSIVGGEGMRRECPRNILSMQSPGDCSCS